MPVYRVYINKRDTRNYIASTDFQKAYEDVSECIVRDWDDDLDLKKVKQIDNKFI